jgi:hypothetical protein
MVTDHGWLTVLRVIPDDDNDDKQRALLAMLAMRSFDSGLHIGRTHMHMGSQKRIQAQVLSRLLQFEEDNQARPSIEMGYGEDIDCGLWRALLSVGGPVQRRSNVRTVSEQAFFQ